MAKTMVANITGARLREADRQLAQLKGASAVNDFLAAYPNETKVLQQLVDWRRAGKPAPALTRVQRAMLWSDGTIEFNTLAAPEPARPQGRPGAAGRDERGQRGGRGERSDRGAGGRASSAGGGGKAPGGRGFGGGAPGGGWRSGGGSGGRGGRFGAGEREGTAGLPRAGEGWALVRPGEAPPETAPPETVPPETQPPGEVQGAPEPEREQAPAGVPEQA